MKKRISKMLTAVLALVLIVATFTSAMAATTDSCAHEIIKLVFEGKESYSQYNSTHHLTRTQRVYRCEQCDELIYVLSAYYEEEHLFTLSSFTGNGTHVGNKHVWECWYRCAYCGYSYLGTTIVKCSGNGVNCLLP